MFKNLIDGLLFNTNCSNYNTDKKHYYIISRLHRDIEYT